MLARCVLVSSGSRIGLAMGWCGRRLVEGRRIGRIGGFGRCRVVGRIEGSIGLPSCILSREYADYQAAVLFIASNKLLKAFCENCSGAVDVDQIMLPSG